MREKFDENLKPIGRIANVICGPFGSAIKNTDYQESGIPLVRITNISKEGYMDYSDLVYISEELGDSLSRTQVSAGDIVISQRGSLGQCAIVDKKFDKLNISANIIAVKNLCGVSVEFLHDYILSSVGQTLLERNVSGQVQQKVTTQDIADLPIPTNCNEGKLSAIVLDAYSCYTQKLQQIEELLKNVKKNLFAEVGIEFSEYLPSLFSFSRLKDIQEMGISCNSHSAYLRDIFSSLRKSKYYVGNLEDFVTVNPTVNRSSLNDNSVVTFVPMPSVKEMVNNATYQLRKYQEVKTGFTAFQKGDLLWAKITPCMQNGKSFLASDMPTEYGFGSTEFHVLRQKNTNVYMPYLWVLLSEEHILTAAQGMFCGSAGQQRVPDTFLKKFPAVLPPLEVQQSLANEVLNVLELSKRIKEEAEQEWQAARKQFEKELLGE